jgi:hypothetical protein
VPPPGAAAEVDVLDSAATFSVSSVRMLLLVMMITFSG